ncbi:MAG TPA: NADH-quinone oxidoreductase subunit NuoG [Aliidongia sp.]|uniref:NADH-quinone oxidoreductase subunit NuoG n=1 Tax=Aliidongia sp. TaxID=1914230 RepID=UPI002DDD588B|nr:NADH-quinone oxidoreductase subunit NuoG [Aliidongia sp.]HEV2678468.1 NADH-quinone oxidoreductase subunit NuoG [Aliidongia sp.]
MPKLTINGQEVEVPAGTTVLQACQSAGVEVPHFCFHERLAIAGNCRMCLVEMEKAPKPVASCAMPVADGQVVYTNSAKAQRARKGVMEFLLINHPLDCPICDQGGECDLQDEAMAFGFDRGRFQENKRAVKDKNFGPLIKTQMTRCIHCTRCVRFATDVAGVSELGATGRGENMEIGTYVEHALTSELSGNMIDLCPVGALTSKPYAFVSRPWELTKTESIDVLDAVGANIRIDARGPEVLRVLPRLHEDVNEEWLGDKGRFAIDGLMKRRLDKPYVRQNGRLVAASWVDAFSAIAARVDGLDGSRIAGIAGDLVDAEAMLALKDLLAGLGSANLDCRQDGAKLPAERAGYLFNTTIAGIDQADVVLFVGTNPRIEAPLINARFRKRYLLGGFKAAVIGPAVDLTYPVIQLGEGPEVLADLADGNHTWGEVLKGAKNPMIVVGQGALAREDGAAVLDLARRLADAAGVVREGWNGFNVLHTAAARVGGLELGFVPGEGGRDVAGILEGARSGAVEVVYLLGADEIDTTQLGKAFVIYQGHHGDAGAARADVVLPGAAYTEKNGTYVNTEGRVQLGRLATFPPGEAREDWKILRALSEPLGHKLPYDNLSQLRQRLIEVNPRFAHVDELVPAEWSAFGIAGPTGAGPFVYPIENYYMTDAVSRSSPTMAACTESLRATVSQKTGTHG